MKYPLGVIALSFSFVIASWFSLSSPETVGSPQNNVFRTAVEHSTEQSAAMNCPVVCNVQDSLILVELYNSTGGAAFMWNNFWFLGDPVCNWYGITVNSAGFVERIELNANGLKGPLPTNLGNGNLTQLQLLQLNNNELNGTLPPSMGNLNTVETMWIDDNEFIGEVPASFGSLSSLESFFLDNNQFTGKIPVTFVNLTNLQSLEFFNNKIDSVPDLSSLTLTADRLRMQNNALTFDDILPNWGPELNDNYFPQDSFGIPYTVNLTTGSTYSLSAGIDDAVTTSTYTWFRNGVQETQTSVNHLDFDPVVFGHAGVWHCRVTNSIATQLTIWSRAITVNVDCGLSVYNESDSLCSFESKFINGTLYNKSNPTDTIFLPSSTVPDGCDSVIYINLYYSDYPEEEIFNETICREDTIFVNGDPYYFGNNFGIYFFPGGSSFECDSALTVNIDFHPASAVGSYAATICRGDTLEYMGEKFYEGKETGMVILQDANIFGCDSTVSVSLSFYPINEVTFDQTYCTGDSVLINGVYYHDLNPTGRDTVFADDVNDCDSILIIDLKFDAFATGSYNDILCPGDSVIINGVTYNENNRTGTDTLKDGSISGCDSIFTVTIDFYNPAIGTYAPTICLSADVTVEGNIYNFGNPKDTLTLPTLNGCDSTLYIDLQFYPKVEVNYSPDFCPGDSEMINGTLYHIGKQTGTEVFSGVTANNCDSTVNVNINFLTEPTGTITRKLCDGGSFTYHGTVFNAGFPTGVVRVDDAAPNGCDSLVTVTVTFYDRAEGTQTLEICEGKCEMYNGTIYCPGSADQTEVLPGMAKNGCDSFVLVTVVEILNAEGTINASLCPGDSLLYNGTYYHDGFRTGTEVKTGAAPNGCDSVIFISVNFYDTIQTNFNDVFCFGETININGTLYSETKRTGTEVFEGVGANGCDSIVYVDISFMGFTQAIFDPTLCDGGSIIINGTLYDTNNRTGRDTLPFGSTSGCDSIIVVDIDFHPPASSILDTTLCPGENLVINGVIYDETNLTGTDTLGGLGTGGCDSMIQVILHYFPEATEEIFVTLCPGDSTTIHGTIYHAGNTTGTHQLGKTSINGCDSTLTVNIDFHPIAEIELTPTICPGQTININGTLYDQTNTSGRDTLVHPITGCDSIVIVNVTVSNVLTGLLDDKLCFDESVTINTNTYDYDNRTGTEMLTSVGNCDSLLTIDLDFFEENRDTFDGTYCEDYSIIVNSSVYDKNTPTGTEIMIGHNSCDSIVVIDLSFSNSVSGSLTGTYCYERVFTINNNDYHVGNPTGSETVTTSSGCDSTIDIDLDFYPEAKLDITETWCFDESRIINGKLYDRNTTSGTEMTTNSNGCDSTITINLTFRPEAKFDLIETWCFDESQIINGTLYDRNNPSGRDTVPTANGCDSTIIVNLTFRPEAKSDLIETWCFDESRMINGKLYDRNNPSGKDTVLTANGCDSTITVDLTFRLEAKSDIIETWCFDESRMINGTLYDRNNPSGKDTIATTNGCDSIVNIDLTFYPEAKAVMSESICDGQFFEFDGETYTEDSLYIITFKQNSANGCDSIIELDLEVLSIDDLGLADAGFDQLACETDAPLSANLPTGVTGEWSCIGGSTVLDPTLPMTTVQNLDDGINTVIWTLSSPVCPSYDSDTVFIELEPLPEAFDDDYTLNHLETFATLEILDNDIFDANIDWFVELFNLPDSGTFELQSDQVILFTPYPDFEGLMTFNYRICSENCPDRCAVAEATIFVEYSPLLIDTTVTIPNGITPNGDGLNDLFIIDALVENPELYPDNELIIFNRWGDVIFEANPYLNNWDGKNQNGEDLPQGTYYYVLRLKLESGEIFKGDVTILK